MKKLLVLTMMLSVIAGLNPANAEVQSKPVPVKEQEMHKMHAMMKAHREAAFEKRLGLTEVQKLKARQVRQKGHDEMRPVMEQIKTKKQEAEMVRRSRMAVQMQEEKLAEIDKELKVLEKKANQIRKTNMKDFESILTWQQKRVLKQMKKEGRKQYRHAHPPVKKPFNQNS